MGTPALPLQTRTQPPWRHHGGATKDRPAARVLQEVRRAFCVRLRHIWNFIFQMSMRLNSGAE